jgi:hypothetical protein
VKLLRLKSPGVDTEIVVHADTLTAIVSRIPGETPGETDLYCEAFPKGITVEGSIEEVGAKWYLALEPMEEDDDY